MDMRNVEHWMGDIVEESVASQFKPLYGKEENGVFTIGGYSFKKNGTWYATDADENGLTTTIAFSGLNAEDANGDTPITIDNYLGVDFAQALKNIGFTDVVESNPEDM